MFSLTTGTPGGGKTLWTIWHVEQRRKKEGREVYYYNIKGVTLPWHELTREQVWKWWELPAGSIIVIDECQDIFPARGTGQKIPQHADMISKHRHYGFDIYGVTQHPMKLDSNVRKDVEEHRHLMRKFGTSWSTVHLWKGVRDNCDKSRKDSISSNWRFPKEAYGWYVSAEVHTHKVRIPLKIWLAMGVVVVLIGLVFYLFVIRGILSPKSEKPKSQEQRRNASDRAVEAGNRNRAPQTPVAMLTSLQPRIQGLPYTAPRYDELTQPVRVPVVVGCWMSESDGWCFTQQGTRLKLPREFMARFIEAGQFLDFDPGPPVNAENTKGSKSHASERQPGPQSGG